MTEHAANARVVNERKRRCNESGITVILSLGPFTIKSTFARESTLSTPQCLSTPIVPRGRAGIPWSKSFNLQPNLGVSFGGVSQRNKIISGLKVDLTQVITL